MPLLFFNLMGYLFQTLGNLSTNFLTPPLQELFIFNFNRKLTLHMLNVGRVTDIYADVINDI